MRSARLSCVNLRHAKNRGVARPPAFSAISCGLRHSRAAHFRDQEARSSNLRTPTRKNREPSAPCSFCLRPTGTPASCRSKRSLVWEKRPPAAGGGSREGAFTAAVEKPEEKRKPERFFGHRKAARSEEARSSNLRTPTMKKPVISTITGFFIFSLSRRSAPYPRTYPLGRSFSGGFVVCMSSCAAYSVPLTLSVTAPGVTTQEPSAARVKLAAGTASCPGSVAKAPVVSS